MLTEVSSTSLPKKPNGSVTSGQGEKTLEALILDYGEERYRDGAECVHAFLSGWFKDYPNIRVVLDQALAYALDEEADDV